MVRRNKTVSATSLAFRIFGHLSVTCVKVGAFEFLIMFVETMLILNKYVKVYNFQLVCTAMLAMHLLINYFPYPGLKFVTRIFSFPLSANSCLIISEKALTANLVAG